MPQIVQKESDEEHLIGDLKRIQLVFVNVKVLIFVMSVTTSQIYKQLFYFYSNFF